MELETRSEGSMRMSEDLGSRYEAWRGNLKARGGGLKAHGGNLSACAGCLRHAEKV